MKNIKDVDKLSHLDETKLFEVFVEDYNTCSMPTEQWGGLWGSEALLLVFFIGVLISPYM